jgi:DNA-binding FadR family transcriptional regulator
VLATRVTRPTTIALQDIEVRVLAEMERGHLGAQLELRQRQLREAAATVARLAPDDSLARLRQLDAERAAQEARVQRPRLSWRAVG